MTSVSTKNKIRGRAYQAKLAEMARGMNVGTLGGEDVMTENFSYEAKTYNPYAKSNKNRLWKGDKILTEVDDRNTHIDALVKVIVGSREPLYLMRWRLWDSLYLLDFPHSIKRERVYLSSFKGYTYMKQAEDNCPDGKIPVVAVHTTRQKHKFDVVLLYEQYLLTLTKKYLTKAFN
jgi:hypothetical protein